MAGPSHSPHDANPARVSGAGANSLSHATLTIDATGQPEQRAWGACDTADRRDQVPRFTGKAHKPLDGEATGHWRRTSRLHCNLTSFRAHCAPDAVDAVLKEVRAQSIRGGQGVLKIIKARNDEEDNAPCFPDKYWCARLRWLSHANRTRAIWMARCHMNRSLHCPCTPTS